MRCFWHLIIKGKHKFCFRLLSVSAKCFVRSQKCPFVSSFSYIARNVPFTTKKYTFGNIHPLRQNL